MGEPQSLSEIKAALGSRSIVMVGLMGCGKSAVGRRLATRLGLPFVDADEEIEKAAGKTIEDIFAEHGEPYFRDGERKVLARLLRWACYAAEDSTVLSRFGLSHLVVLRNGEPTTGAARG